MPTWTIELSDGRLVDVESDQEPNEESLLPALDSWKEPQQPAPPPAAAPLESPSWLTAPQSPAEFGSPDYGGQVQAIAGNPLVLPTAADLGQNPVLELPEDNGKGRLRSAGASFMQGGGVGVGTAMSGAVRLLDSGAASALEEAAASTGNRELFTMAEQVRNRTPEQKEADIARDDIYKAGQELTAGAKEAFVPNPTFRGEFWTDTMPSAGGQMVPTVAAGIINPALAAAQYGLSSGQQGAEESIAKGDIADVDKVFLAYLGLGALSEFALGVPANILRYAQAARKAGVGKETAKAVILKAVGKGGAKEAAQESLEQVGQNITAQQTFDPKRKTLEGVPESLAAGFLLGGAGAGVAAGVGALEQPTTTKAPTQPPNAPQRTLEAEQTPVRRGAVEDYPGEPGEVVVTAEELKAPAKAEITPAQEQAIAARGGMESLPYEASDLTRYNELKAEQGNLQSEGKIISPETGEFTAEWSGNWKEFEALRNKYNGMPPKQVATASNANAQPKEAVAGTGEQPAPAIAKPAANKWSKMSDGELAKRSEVLLKFIQMKREAGQPIVTEALENIKAAYTEAKRRGGPENPEMESLLAQPKTASTPAPENKGGAAAKKLTPLQELDALVIKHGVDTGRILDLELLLSPRETATSNIGSGIKAKVQYSAQLKAARERIASDFGISKAKLDTPAGRTELLAKLKHQASLPKLRPGEKGTGELLQGKESPFNLVSEKAVDGERIAAEAKAKEETEKAAAEFEDTNQTDMFPEGVGDPADWKPGPGAKTATASQKPAAPESYEGTGLKHAVDELERLVLGFGERPQQERQGMAAAFARAGETLAKDSLAGQRLADQLIANPRRGLTGDESALLLRHKVDAFNALNRAAEKTLTGTPEAKAEALVEYDTLAAKFKLLLDAINERGSEAGRELRWRQAIAYEDFTFATQERLLRASKGGEPLTNTERNKLLAEIETHKATIAQLEKDRAAEAIRFAQAEVTDTVATVRAQSKKDKAAGRVRDLAAEQKAVVDHLKEQFLENDADLSGEGISIRKLMELLVEREGITERLKMEDRIHEILQAEVDPTITREQAMDLMSGYGKSRLPNPAFAKRTVRDINAQILSVRKLLDYFKGQRPKLTGQLRDAPSQIQRNWIKMVNEAKKAFHLEDTGDNAKLVKSAIDAINTRLTNRIKDLKSEIVTRHKIIRERSPSPYNAETLELRRELEEVQKAHKEIFGEPTLSDAQRLDRAEKAAERQIVELQRQLDSGEIFSKRQQAFGLSSPKLEAAKARRDELEAQRKWAREAAQPKPEPHEQFALNYLLRLRQRAAEYNERAARGDFSKPVKPPREHGPDVLKAMAEVEQSKQNFYQARYEAAQRLRSVPRKIWDGIRATKDAFVNIKSSFDFSAPRQMFLAILGNSTEMLTNPIAGTKVMFKPFGRMFQAWWSESKSAVAEQRRKIRQNATSGADKTAGIQYTELHTTDFTKAEENARSILDEWAKLPLKTGNLAKTAVTLGPKALARGVRMSNRAFITALNEMRSGLFDYLLSVNYKDRAPTDAELRVVGNLVNVSTGRGKLSRGVAKVTGEVLWSPSLLASRLQVLTGQPLWTGLLSGDAKGSFRARKIVAKQYARWLISGAALYGISRLFTDDEEAEPTSSDLGKTTRHNTRIDPWAGFQQPIVATARIVTGESTSIEGKARDINAGEVIWNFFKNKTRPDVVAIVKGVIAAIDSGKDERDVRVTPKEAAMEMLPVPLALQDVIKVMRENGMAEGAIIQVLSEFGVGVNVYEEYERQR